MPIQLVVNWFYGICLGLGYYHQHFFIQYTCVFQMLLFLCSGSIIIAQVMNKILEKWVNYYLRTCNLYCTLMVHQLNRISNVIGFFSKDYYQKQLCFLIDGFIVFFMVVLRIYDFFLLFQILYFTSLVNYFNC